MPTTKKKKMAEQRRRYTLPDSTIKTLDELKRKIAAAVDPLSVSDPRVITLMAGYFKRQMESDDGFDVREFFPNLTDETE